MGTDTTISFAVLIKMVACARVCFMMLTFLSSILFRRNVKKLSVDYLLWARDFMEICY